jgi:hypothetical protein
MIMSGPLNFLIPLSLEEWKDSLLEHLPALLVDNTGTIVRNTRLAETVLRVLVGGLVTKKMDVFLPGSGIMERVVEQGNISTAIPGVATVETFGLEGSGIRGDGSFVKLWLFTYAFCAKTTGELHVGITLFELGNVRPSSAITTIAESPK